MKPNPRMNEGLGLDRYETGVGARRLKEDSYRLCDEGGNDRAYHLLTLLLTHPLDCRFFSEYPERPQYPILQLPIFDKRTSDFRSLPTSRE